MNCQNCGAENPEEFKFCGRCGTPLVTQPSVDSAQSILPQQPEIVEVQAASETTVAIPAQATPAELAVEQRKTILDAQILKYITTRFRLVARSDTTAQLIRPKSFSCCWGTFWFLFFGVGVLIYIFYYMSKKDETVYLEVDPYGQVKVTQSYS